MDDEKCTDFENWEIETTIIHMCTYMLIEMIRIETLPKSQFVVKLYHHLFKKILGTILFVFQKYCIYFFLFIVCFCSSNQFLLCVLVSADGNT